MKVDLNPCFILHRRAYGETSLILEAFSAGHGRISLVARGARQGKRRLSSLLQPARRLNLSWSGRSELVTLTGAEADAVVIGLDGRRMLSAFYLNELLLRLFHKHDADPELFRAYEDSLLRLSGGESEDRVLRLFEKQLLGSLGYGLILDRETRSGDRISADRDYWYHFDHGPDISKLDALDAVRISGRTLTALHNGGPWDNEVARQAKLLLRNIIDGHLENKPLQSRELFKAYLKYQVSGRAITPD